MKPVYPGIILGVMLLTSLISASYASGGSIEIMAKEKQGRILLLIKNGQSVNIHGLKITLLDGDILSVKVNQDWIVKSASDPKTVTLVTDRAPVKANERMTISLVASRLNTIISWSATDRFGSTIDADSTRSIVRQILDKAAPANAELSYIANARSLDVSTDKIFYNKSDKMFISGLVDPNTDVTITIYAPNGQKIKITDQTDQSGNFKALHVLRDADSGTYRLKVGHAGGYAETTFKVL